MIRKLVYLILMGLMLLACDRVHHYMIANEDYRLLDHEGRFIYRCEKNKVMINLEVYSIVGGLHVQFVVNNKGPLFIEYDMEQISVIAAGVPYQIPRRRLSTEPVGSDLVLEIEPNDSTKVFLTALPEGLASMPPSAQIHLGKFVSETGQIVAVFDSIDVRLMNGR